MNAEEPIALSPEYIRKHIVAFKRESIVRLVAAVNSFLSSGITSSAFSMDLAVYVDGLGDSEAPAWGAFHAEVMQKFRENGWIVKRHDSSLDRPSYEVSLPSREKSK